MKTTNFFLNAILVIVFSTFLQKNVIAQAIFAANGKLISLRDINDLNHGMIYNGSIDGPEFRAFKSFVWKNGSIGSNERMRLDANGNLGINNANPQYKLDVVGRARFQSGPDGGIHTGNNYTAGIWLTDAANIKEQAFVGMVDDNRVGMYGSTTGWGLTMDVNDGNVGIGVNIAKTPSAKLEVNGNTKINGATVINQTPLSTDAIGTLKLLNNHNTIGDKWFLGFGTGANGSDVDDNVRLQTETTAAGSIFTVISGGKVIPLAERFRINEDGNVGIGTVTPTELLTVGGTIKCTSIVTDASTFPDYVFKEGYVLQPLSKVNNYIKTNSKLPGMPSEAEVLKNGLNVSQVTISAVEKIEELYLYIIELNAKMKMLEDKLNKKNKN